MSDTAFVKFAIHFMFVPYRDPVPIAFCFIRFHHGQCHLHSQGHLAMTHCDKNGTEVNDASSWTTSVNVRLVWECEQTVRENIVITKRYDFLLLSHFFSSSPFDPLPPPPNGQTSENCLNSGQFLCLQNLHNRRETLWPAVSAGGPEETWTAKPPWWWLTGSTANQTRTRKSVRLDRSCAARETLTGEQKTECLGP